MDADRELLELAAKAAGMTEFATASFWSAGYRVRDGSGDGWYPWNPLESDADAFRLAVKLRLLLHIWDNKNVVVVSPGNNAVEFTDDPYAATRRAIVRAAAKIGRNLT